jgi:hypothetical protein
MGELRSKATLLRRVAEILQQPLGREPMRAPPGAALQAGRWGEVQVEAAALAANSLVQRELEGSEICCGRSIPLTLSSPPAEE